MAASDIKDVVQLAIVTADLDRAMSLWTEKYGVGPWTVSDFDRARLSDWTVDGDRPEFEMRSAIATLGNGGFTIELIQPVSGESVWGTSLAEHGGVDHLHHVLCAYETDDFEAGIDDFRRKGIPVTQTGHYQPGSGISWAYLDTEPDLGFTLEFVTMPGGFPAKRS